MAWGVVGMALTALLVFVLVYPFRIHLHFGTDHVGSAPQGRINLRGPFNMTIELPIRRNAPGESKGDSHGADASNGDTATADASNSHPLSHLLIAVSFIHEVLISPPDSGPGKTQKGPIAQFIGPRMDMLHLIRRCEQLTWTTRFGTGEAALTALLTGTLWSLKSVTYAVLSRRVDFQSVPEFLVDPDWEDILFAINIDCIFRFYVGEIILAWMGGTVRKWQKGVHRFEQ